MNGVAASEQRSPGGENVVNDKHVLAGKLTGILCHIITLGIIGKTLLFVSGSF